MRCIHLILPALLLLLSGCTGLAVTDIWTDDPDVRQGVGDTWRDGADTAPVGFDVAVTPETVEEPDLFFELSEEETTLGCQPGEGCFLDGCEENSDCLFGWCVGHMGEDVCTRTCEEECPPGWACKAAGSGGPDVVYICVSNFANLCRPCFSGDNCQGTAGEEDVCVDYGDEGSFCGGKCATNEDCPWGFSCSETQTVDGIAVKQCVADAGVCPCTGKSVELALWTPCEAINEFGTCDGKRVCAQEGLLECDAPLPAVEECNGKDDNCDGDIDEETCDDGNSCTIDGCQGEEGCVYTPQDLGECLDGDSCTIGDHCEEGICVGTPIDCDDDNPCTDDSCDGLGGCAFEVNNAVCDDGDPCTVADQCSASVCAGTAVSCECQEDADCAVLEDGNLCNGTLVCDQSKLPYLCAVDPVTVIQCPQPEGLDAICLQAHCEPETGECSLVPDHEGFACDDGDACIMNEKCVAGQCAGGVAPLCNDGNPCTGDSCDEVQGCLFVPNSAACDDGNVCTIGDVCADGECAAGAQTLQCDDYNPCTSDECQPGVGCGSVPDDTLECDDNNPCTEGDHCSAGACVVTGTMDCDDKDPCTNDFCNPSQGCVHKLNAAPCDDGNACTLGDVCDMGTCAGPQDLLCDDDNACTQDGCDPAAGCTFASAPGECDDENACTTGDVCTQGKCKATGIIDCDDDNSCTTDACDVDAGCVSLPIEGDCEDGDLCTSGDYCDGGVCKPGVAVVCDDGKVCTDDSCNSALGCVANHNQADCDDGNACTTGDICAEGECTGPEEFDCNDNNVCTDDSCNPYLGCVNAFNQEPCSDNDACTENDGCLLGECQPGEPLVCSDGNVCTDDTCDAQKGCEFVLNLVPCDDGDACTVDDSCANGICQPGEALSCDDGNDCTENDCSPDDGCVYPPITPCCGNGVPEQGEQCDDGNTNNNDSCANNCTTQQYTNGMGGHYYTTSTSRETNSKLACESHWGANQCCNDGCGSCNHRGYHKCGTPNCNGSTYWNYLSTDQFLDCGWVNPNEILVSYDNKNWVQ